MTRNAASQRQVDAARPDTSTWLSANAGSGKTRVLTDRVARLLLGGVDPQNILCVTYTKAAATEMQNRLFQRLGAWAMLPDGPLAQQLWDLGLDSRPTPAFLAEARTLFAKAIETPGGLRIQTIHSFCSALLRRFPLEAGVSPQFTEIEERAAEILRDDILTRMAEGPDAPLMAEVAAQLTADDGFAVLAAEVVQRRAHFDGLVDKAQIWARHGVPEQLSLDAVVQTVLPAGELEFVADVARMLAAGSPNDVKAGVRLGAVKSADAAALKILEEVCLTKSGAAPFTAKIGKLPTKATREGAMAAVTPRLEALMQRVEEARPLRLGLAAAARDLTLHRFAAVFLPAYTAEKQLRGWLDFDDLIDKARALLSDSAVAEWVLYRLDGGLDHILVDEAQDTSPVQWQVIERLAQEFTSGQGARADVARTIFVVGDKKQSIYSFQGADPEEFDRMRKDFQARLTAVGQPFQSQSLDHSFRSATQVLELVDRTFGEGSAHGLGDTSKHLAFHEAMPGRVDLWPLVPTAEKQEEEGTWFEPVDRPGARHHTVILAQRVAQFISDTVVARTAMPDAAGGAARAVTPGDFLILVQRRSPLFTEIIRACKQAGLPIAGADRLKVMAELAVRDIGALLSFLATPEDDLSLAVALKSPLFGWDEQRLFDLAHRRTERYLWQALRARAPEFPKVIAVLDDLMGQTDFLRPYDLIDRILTRHDGRRLLLGRLGEEAQDGIDALLSQALAYERTQIPSLTGFLQWMQTDDLEIKRQQEGAGDRVRVMTVHGAKGLEAPIVILPDCGPPRTDLRGRLLADENGVTWRMPADAAPDRQKALEATAKAAQAAERDRLLYVALTRAEKWLVVAAGGDLGKSGQDWYTKISRGMEASNAAPAEFDFGALGQGPGLSLGGANWPQPPKQSDAPAAPHPAEVPKIAHQLAPARLGPPPPLSPSDLGGAKALQGAEGDTTETALARGTLLHRLLEVLPTVPPPKRARIARSLAESMPEAQTVPDIESCVQEALTVLDTGALSSLFDSRALAEVPLTATLPDLGGRRIHGIIDRLILAEGSALAVDFKTNRRVPETAERCPEGILRQMGAYASALAQIYPGRRIETAVLWTQTAQLMPLPHGLVSAALTRATIP